MSTPSFRLTVDDIELTLVEFDGEEEMNRLFKYTFTTEIPTRKGLGNVIDADAVFTIVEYDTELHRGDIQIPGYISKASKTSSNWILEFSPKLLKNTTNKRSEIYFSEDRLLTALTVIESEFENDINLTGRTAIFDILTTLPGRKLFCQFRESNWNYVARLCDHWGFHFYFDHYNNTIVFADNNGDEKKFTSQLETTSSTADNSLLTIVNWQESVVSTESYTKIVGHDYENAGTPISAIYPVGTLNTGPLTESSHTCSDVNSQDEAVYIAQIRQEAADCRNQLASGEVKIPYLMPGLPIGTDDSDYTQALIIKTVNTARNLNPTNSGTAASFVCKFEAIPSNICFRPSPHYEVPTATNVIGKIISETDDIEGAHRNDTGEYKAELLGFENESSVHPWLRRAQITASNNSVDIPLTPNTEVSVSFYDNNPNCPFIQHAYDNSLHPSPVTAANPNHAIISTYGMLVTNSLNGRLNTATTPQTSGSGYTGVTTANYFTERGDFDQHTNFIDPSATNADFTADDKDSGNLIFTQHKGDSVEIREGDKLNWHNGNIYDFGGYWNYNLGNSYEENFIDQEAPLNIKVDKDGRSGDILPSGPNPGVIPFQALLHKEFDISKDLAIDVEDLEESNIKPISYSDTGIATNNGIKTFKVNSSGPWNANGMNITKDYNATYDYKFGEGIEISDRVNSLEITHTDAATTAIEMNFHNGALRSWEKTHGRNSWSKSWTGDGGKTSESSTIVETEEIDDPNPADPKKVEKIVIGTKIIEKEGKWNIRGKEKTSSSETITTADSITTDEKSFNMDTGALATHNTKTTNGMATDEMDFSFAATSTSNFNFGASTSFSLSAQADVSLAISFSGAIAVEIGFGLAATIQIGIEKNIECDYRFGTVTKLDAKGKFVTENLSIVAGTEVRARAKVDGMVMQVKNTAMVKCAMKLANTNVDLMRATLRLRAGLEIAGM